MIDRDDVDTAWLEASFAPGPGCGLIMIVIAIVVTLAYCANEDECAHMRCSNGSEPKLMEHECLCVERAR